MAVVTPPNGPWTSASSPGYSIDPVPIAVFEALEAGDLELASSEAPASLPPLTPFLVNPYNRNLWRRRLADLVTNPGNTPWMSRVVIYKAEPDPETQESQPAVVVGRIGFHGKPNERSILEVGYEIDPVYQRKGHATAAMRIIIDTARAIQGVNILRASVAEEKWISRRIVEKLGFEKVGQEMNPRRGPEDVYLLDVSS